MRRELTRRDLRALLRRGEDHEAAARIVEHVGAVGEQAAMDVLAVLAPVEAQRLRALLVAARRRPAPGVH